MNELYIRNYALRAPVIPQNEFPTWENLRIAIMSCPNSIKDVKRWTLAANGIFSVRTFYNFLNDGGLRCRWTATVLKGPYPKKINLFNWLAWDNKILTLENLALCRCNLLQITTCVMCHAGTENVEYLLLYCPFAARI